MEIVKIYNDKVDMYVHSDSETVSNIIRYTKTFFEIELLNFLEHNFNEQTNIIDIGANIGNHSVFFSKFLKYKKIYAFEPYEKNIMVLKKNLENTNSTIYEVALSNKKGLMPLYNSDASNYGGFSLHCYPPETYGNSSFLVQENIEVTTLDTFNFSDISLIKIDVENHENEVLEGAMKTINTNKPIIILENLYHGYPLICTNPDPHKKILQSLDYIKLYSNIGNSFMDLWIHKSMV